MHRFLHLQESIFKAYDIRGIVGAQLTPDVVFLLGRAIGSAIREAKQNTVVVGRDGRLSGMELTQALIKGLCQSGINVTDVGRVPTPVLYYACYGLKIPSGIMVTGSHNPPDYNGFKIVVNGVTLAGQEIKDLYKRILTENFYSGDGNCTDFFIDEIYIQRVVEDISLHKRMRVVIDCGNGIPGEIAPKLFRALGCEVFELFTQVDGNFPNHHPDPSKLENLENLIEAVKQHQADLGIAFDGDGDRLGVVTQTGKIIWPDRQLMLMVADVLSRNPGGTIVYDVKCSKHLETVIREHGGEPLMWKTGHSHIKAKMRETGALLGGEMSGHIFFKERWYGFDDGLYSGARLLEILSKDARDVDTIFKMLPDSVNTPELQITVEDADKFNIIEMLQCLDISCTRKVTLDGLRIEYPDGWGLVRASNTTPVLVLRFEAETTEALIRIKAIFAQALLTALPDKSTEIKRVLQYS